MDQKFKDKLAKLLDEEFIELSWALDGFLEEWLDYEKSGFVHTITFGDYVLRGLLDDDLVDPKVKADQMIRDLLREATLKARGYPSY